MTTEKVPGPAAAPGLAGVAAAAARRQLRAATVNYEAKADKDISSSVNGGDFTANLVSNLQKAGSKVASLSTTPPVVETEIDYTVKRKIVADEGDESATAQSVAALSSGPPPYLPESPSLTHFAPSHRSLPASFVVLERIFTRELCSQHVSA